MTHSILISLCAMSSVFFTSCKTSEENSSLVQSTEISDAQCSTSAMKKRRQATFERTSSCAIDAIGGKLADQIHYGSIALAEIRAMGKLSIRTNQILKTTRLHTVSTAKVMLCYKTVNSILSNNLIKSETEDLLRAVEWATGNDKVEFKTFAERLESYATFDTIAAWRKLNAAIETPNFETLVDFAGSAIQSAADTSLFATTCLTAMASLADESLPNISALYKATKVLGTVGTAGALVNCTKSAFMNGVDVTTELACWEKDLKIIAEQNKKIGEHQEKSCKDLGIIANLPTSKPIILAKLDDETEASVNRLNLCYSTIRAWGSCLARHADYWHHDDGDNYSNTKERCEAMCRGYVNAVPHPTLARELARIASFAEAESTHDALNTVHLASMNCTVPGNPKSLVNDGLQPCINACLSGNAGSVKYTSGNFYN